MDDIQRIAILGAGAIGAYFAASFFDTPGFSTSIIARGERFDRLSNEGLIVNDKKYNFPVIHPDEASEVADLILVALKHHQLPHAVGDLQNLVGGRTTIISMMNGLDSEEYIGAVYGMDKMLYGTCVGIDAMRQGNRITYTKPGTHYFGKADNTHLTQPVRQVQIAFDRAGISYKTPTDMMRIMWWKFMVNVGVNQASAVLCAPYGVFRSSPEAKMLVESLSQEVILLAESYNVNLVKKDLEDWFEILSTMSPGGKTSMLQDIEAGRKTEVEIFGGKVIALGKASGIPTPVNQTVYNIIKVIEQSSAA